jgi:hypothetical protein
MKPLKAIRARRRPRNANDKAANVLRTSHLRREVKTALELAVAALAHAEVIDALATAAGLLEALAEFPDSSPPVLATLPRATEKAESALETWRNWQAQPTHRRSA